MKKVNVSIIIVMMFALLHPINLVFAETPIKVLFDGSPLMFDNPPIIKNQTTFVEFRPICEALHLDVNWDPVTRTVNCQDKELSIHWTTKSNIAYVNGKRVVLETSPFVQNERILVPLRFISETSGSEVIWNFLARTIHIKPSTKPIVEQNPLRDFDTYEFLGISIGDAKEKLFTHFGEPNRILPSVSGYEWYVYNSNYENFIQFGIENETVVAVYTGATFWHSLKGVHIGLSREQVSVIYEDIQSRFQPYQYSYNEVVNLGEVTAKVYYDYFEKTVASIYLLSNSYSHKVVQWNDTLAFSLQNQLFDFANMVRVQQNKSVLMWDDNASIAASAHSEDMAKRNYYDHLSPEGETPWDRLSSHGVIFRNAGENIYMTPINAMDAHQGWMNSIGHRANILGDFRQVGIGVASSNEGIIFYTQNFFTPR